MLGTFISSSSKILVALDPVTPKRIVRVWEAHRPDSVVSNPNIMEFTWHNPSLAAEQPRILDEIAVALGFRVSKHSSDRSSPSANIKTGSLSRASRSPSPSPSRGWGSIPLSIILRDYRRHVFNAIETYADDKQSLCLLMEEALKPRGQSSLIQEHDLIPPYPLRWRTMTVSVRHCAEAFLSLLEDPSIESLTPLPCVSWPPSLAKRVLSVKEYRTLVANLADSLRDVPSVLLTLLKEARSDGTTPNLEAMKLLPPTSFSWELMMKIIEEEVLKIIGPSTSISDASSHTPKTSSHLEDNFMNRVLDALERNAAHEDQRNSPLDSAVKWLNHPGGMAFNPMLHLNHIPLPMATRTSSTDAIPTPGKMESTLCSGLTPDVLHIKVGHTPKVDTPKRRRDSPELSVPSAAPRLPKGLNEGSVWDFTETGSQAPTAHKRQSFPPPLVIRSFHSSVLRPKRPRLLVKKQALPVAVPPTRPRDLENKVGSLTTQVSEMMDLMKTLVAQRPLPAMAAEVLDGLAPAEPQPGGDTKHQIDTQGVLTHKKKSGWNSLFQWTEVSFDLSSMARFRWEWVSKLLILIFSTLKTSIFFEIGWGESWEKISYWEWVKLISGNCFLPIFSSSSFH